MWAVIAQAFEHVAVMVEQIIAVLLEQCGPVVLRRHGARLIVWRRPAQVHRLEEQQIRKLLHVIAVAHPIVPEDVAVVPAF